MEKYKPNYVDAKERVDSILDQLKDTWFFHYLGTEYEVDNYEYVVTNPQAVPHYIVPWNHKLKPIANIVDFLAYGNYPENIRWSNGASRVVIWDENEPDYVLKIARNPGYDKYNQREEEIYVDAWSEDAEEAFAWISCIYGAGALNENGYTNLSGIYAVEFADCDEELISEHASTAAWEEYCEYNNIDYTDEKEREHFFDYEYEGFEYDEDSVVDFAASHFWGEEVSQKVWKLIRKFNINDLHTGNFGFRNNMMIMTDYAGWGW